MSIRPRRDRAWDRGSDAIGAALTFAVAVALFAWLGHRADVWLGTSPLCLIVGGALGVVGGFLHLLRVLAPDLLPWSRKPDRSAPKDHAAPNVGADRRAVQAPAADLRTPDARTPDAPAPDSRRADDLRTGGDAPDR